MFQLWQQHEGDWAKVGVSCGLLRKNTQNGETAQNYMTEKQLLAHYAGDEELTKEGTRRKTAAGDYITNPDAPDILSGRLYLFSAAAYKNIAENIREDRHF